MHVFFDDQIFVSQEQGGISRYFTELARELGQAGVSVRLFAGITRNRYVPALRQAAGVTARFHPRRDRLRINTWMARFSRIWRRWDFAQFRHQSSAVVYHATNYAVDPWIAHRAQATCLTVFDMIGELLCDEPSRTRSLELKRRGVPLADGIFCISAQTQRDFLRCFPDCQPRSKVTHLAASLPAPSAENLATASAHAPYLLLVGNRLGYKNGLAAFRAFATLAGKHRSLKVLCFGGEPLSADEQGLLAGAGLQERVLAVRGDDGLLAGFYAKASALLYPSRYEGFGLPVLEAMRLECPVITTRCASLPEVAGNAALYVDPDDVPGLAAATDRLLRDEAWRQGWILAGREQCALFSWAKTAQETKEAYAVLLAGRDDQSGTGVAERVKASSGSNRS
jgi:glycosyltransferase involved in cell wall biosynthesis